MSIDTNQVRRKSETETFQEVNTQDGDPASTRTYQLYRDVLIDLMCRYPLLIPEAVDLLMQSPQLQIDANRRKQTQPIGPTEVRLSKHRGRPKGSKNKPKH